MVDVLYEKFASEGFDVLKAPNGKEGLETALKSHPDLILLDIIMPVMDGMTMLEKIRQDEWGKDAKIILLTNLSDSDKITQSLSRGVHGYLIKSDWKLEDIVKKVNEELSEPDAGASNA